MSATNAHILRAIDDYGKKIVAEVESRCKQYCKDLCFAAINFRKNHPEAHDFTGNLLNSIVVGLYKNGQPLEAFYASEQGIPKAITVKMSANAKYRKRYYFNPDYSGDASVYRAEVQTDKGWGEEDAKKFFASYQPVGKSLFHIVVAYTVEYAEWLYGYRGTEGFLQTFDYADKVATTFLQLPRV